MYLTAKQAREISTNRNNKLRHLMEQINNAANAGKVDICITGVSFTTRNLLQNLGYKVEHNMSTGTTLIEW